MILSVAALEDKHQYLAGPKLLSRLSGEAWRCTEHLSIADVRSDRGWLTVLECLDKHYRHLPEVELHESIDDFLFHLKKRPHEGTTAFSARFKTALSRLETLIHSERKLPKQRDANVVMTNDVLHLPLLLKAQWKIHMILQPMVQKLLNKLMIQKEIHHRHQEPSQLKLPQQELLELKSLRLPLACRSPDPSQHPRRVQSLRKVEKVP